MIAYPKISIVTPSFNQAAFLEATILSVINQQYPNLEFIVIDGGSTDGSVGILKNHSSSLHYWCSEQDQGHADALNKGFSLSDGEIMGWVNSDDLLAPWSLRTIADIFIQFPHVQWIQGFASTWNIHGQMVSARRNLINQYDYLLGNYSWIQQESVFWRRSLWNEAGGFISPNMKLMVDGELWSRFFLHSQMHIVDCVLGGWRNHGFNRSLHDMNSCHSEMQSCIRQMFACIDDKTLLNYDRLVSLFRLSQGFPSRLLGRRMVERFYLDFLQPDLLVDTGYSLLSWDFPQSRWIESRLPFSLVGRSVCPVI